MKVGFHSVAVLGFGTMGGGIAQVVARSGRRVVVLDTDQERVDAGRRAVSTFLDKGVRLGKTARRDADRILDLIIGTTSVADLADADLVIEAVVEQRAVKTELLSRVGQVVRTDTVIATNTSALSVSDLAASVALPGRFAGLHFFNPAPLMRLVEVVAAIQTDPAVMAALVGFIEDVGKVPVRVKDRPGFLVNSLLMPYLNDVVREYDDGLASAEDIDQAIELGLGHRLGPLALLDLIGLDVHHRATQAAYEATRDPQFASPPLLRRMVAADYLGRRSGRGFRVDAGLEES